jgi:hypothetical protein
MTAERALGCDAWLLSLCWAARCMTAERVLRCSMHGCRARIGLLDAWQPPECWAKGTFVPDGHTVSISDLYFIGHFVGLLRSVVGFAKTFDVVGVTLSGGSHIMADVVIKAVGFEFNEGCERLLGRSRLHGGSVVDQGIFTLFEAHPDGNFSNSAFGSYLDTVPYNVQLMLRYWQHADLYDQQHSRLFARAHGISARINRITTSEAGVGMAFLIEACYGEPNPYR